MEIQQLKQDIVNTLRMLERAEHIDFNGHVSARIPTTNDILINDRRASRSALTADEIIRMDLDGNVKDEDGQPPNEFPLHTEIYRHRKDVGAVAHTHPKWSTLFTISRVPLRPVIIQGAVIGDAPIFPKAFSISNTDIANELVQTLGDEYVILMKAHGAAIVGQNLREVFARSVFLEENARRQYMAGQLGDAYALEEDEIIQMKEFIWQPKNIQKVWDNHLSKL